MVVYHRKIFLKIFLHGAPMVGSLGFLPWGPSGSLNRVFDLNLKSTQGFNSRLSIYKGGSRVRSTDSEIVRGIWGIFFKFFPRGEGESAGRAAARQCESA